MCVFVCLCVEKGRERECVCMKDNIEQSIPQ